MDIFVIKLESLNNVPVELIKQFQKKEISNQHKFLAHSFSYLMLDRVLRDFYGFEDRELLFNGRKPFLKSGKKFLSMSHSKEFLALAFSDYPCGVDIEKNTERDFQRIAKRMGFECDSLRAFYEAWTRFEALYKLGTTAKTVWTSQLDNYTITAVGENEEEVEFYFQSN